MPRAQGAGTRVRAVPADARIVPTVDRADFDTSSVNISQYSNRRRRPLSESHSVVWVGSKHGSKWQVIHI